MNDSLENSLFPQTPKERPFECTDCKRKIKVLYTEVVQDSIINTVMCAECPEFKKRLHGVSKEELGGQGTPSEKFCCGNCGTTLDSIKVSNQLGCQICYEVFQDIVFQDLLHDNRIPRAFLNLKPQETLHLGKYPTHGESLSPSTRLIALNEALQATLKKEDYEQAALLRDQIKQLTENSETKELVKSRERKSKKDPNEQ